MSPPHSLRAGPLHYHLRELAARVGGALLAGDPTLPIGGLAADTRAVQPGDLFAAIRGERVDAHTLLPAAFAAGARAALVDRDPGDLWQLRDVPPGCGVIRVPAVIPALGRLAARHLEDLRPRPTVVGVTGSVGKTGTRRLLAAALSAGGPVLDAEGSFNTEISLPLVCLRARGDHRFVTLELAMRGRGQIAYLAAICRPEVGVVTVIGDSHLEQLGSRAAIAAAKAELLEALPSCGLAVLNRDDPWQRRMAAQSRAPVLWYGLGADADVTARDIRPLPEGGLSVTALLAGRPVPLRLRLLGRPQLANALAALACADRLGVEPERAAAALGQVRAAEGRLHLREAGPLRILDDTFNAAPQSMLAALEALADLVPVGRRAAVLGDMLELGPASIDGHRRVGEAAATAGLSWLLAVGPRARDIAAGARQAGLPAARIHEVADRHEAAAALPALLAGAHEGTAVLVKGSHALGLEEVVGSLVEWSRARAAGGAAPEPPGGGGAP